MNKRKNGIKKLDSEAACALTEQNLLILYRVTFLKYPDLMSILQVAEASSLLDMCHAIYANYERSKSKQDKNPNSYQPGTL